MKTAISVPDDVFNEAEQVAVDAGISRSELYVTALKAFLDRSRDERVTQQLNAVYEAHERNSFLDRAASSLVCHSQHE